MHVVLFNPVYLLCLCCLSLHVSRSLVFDGSDHREPLPEKQAHLRRTTKSQLTSCDSQRHAKSFLLGKPNMAWCFVHIHYGIHDPRMSIIVHKKFCTVLKMSVT